MTGAQEAQVTVRDDFDLVAWDLATVSGALSAIATPGRRARARRPDLPLVLPQRLADMAGELAADARSLAGTRRGQARDLALSVSLRMSALSEGVAYARAITSGPDAPAVGDAPLWEFLHPALRRTDSRLAG